MNMATINLAMLSMNELFYGEREPVQILKDENSEILEIIHRYNYFYTESPPLSDVDITSDAEEEDLESNWSDVGLPAQVEAAAVDEKKDANIEVGKSVGGQTGNDDAKVALKVPMCCAECEETVIIALKSVSGNQPATGYHSTKNYSIGMIVIGIIVTGGIVIITAIGLH